MPFVAHRALGWLPVEIDESWGLKTIKQGMAYSICNSVYCVDCGFLFLDMRFSDTELGALYSGYRGQQYTELREHYEPGYKSRNDNLVGGIGYITDIEAFLTPHITLPLRMLDWGGDTGENTPFKTDNTVFHIYDISNKPVVAGAEPVDKTVAFGTTYDLVICSNVLEHVPYPSDLIEDMKHTMTKDTVLYIEVPHEEVMRMSVSGGQQLPPVKKHWHEHINFFSEKSLRRLVDGCGLEVIALHQLKAEGYASTSFHFQIACKLKGAAALGA